MCRSHIHSFLCLSIFIVLLLVCLLIKEFLSIFSVRILKVYYASTSRKTIERVNFNGGSREVLVSEGLDSPEGLAIDWVHRKMYWADKRCVVFAHSKKCTSTILNILDYMFNFCIVFIQTN